MGKRIFIYDGKELPDIDPSKTSDDIRKHYADFFPELYNAEVKQSKQGESDVYTFSKRVGTKSGTETVMINRVVTALRGVPPKSLRLIEMANKIPIRDGILDQEELECMETEINLAIMEANTYTNQTIQAVAALKEVGARQKNVG
jgi:PRTRC genetic system protein C